MSKPSVCLLVVDPQVDFCDKPQGQGGIASLSVAGADQDMIRLGKMIEKNGQVIDSIELTMDCHYYVHISHGCWWVDKKGDHPTPFTSISEESVLDGTWRAYDPERQDWSVHYVKTLKANNRYQIMIWPVHCEIGTPGQCIYPPILKAIQNWEQKYFGMAVRTTKGSNIFTEHFSAVKADVEDPNDPTTRLNDRFVNTLKKYDKILISGEALSHCVCNTVRDTAAEFSDEQVKKFVLLEDASSNVGGCEKLGENFVNAMVAKGMQISRTDKFFK